MNQTDVSPYKKVCVYMKNRKKRVQFSLNHNLYRSESLSKDLRLLKCDNYESAGPYESHVFGERYDLDHLKAHVTLTEGNFWDFLYSPGWNDFSSIRVTDGSLMKSLLYTYFMLELNDKILSYTTEVYEHNISTALQGSKVHDESIKITFTYYGRTKDSLRRTLERDGITTDPHVHFTNDQHKEEVQGRRKHYARVHFPDVLNDSRSKRYSSREHTRRRLACPMNCELRPETAPDWMIGRPDSANVMPDNPPNSPLLEYPRPSTMEMLRQRKVERVRVLASCRQRKREFEDLPLITQTRLKRPRDGEIISSLEVVGTQVKLDTSVDVIGWLEKEISMPLMKSSLRLPKIESKQAKTPTYLMNKPFKKLKPDIRKFGKHSPKLEFINVINPMSTTSLMTPTKDPRSDTPSVFDTGKLKINYSLEHIRPDIVRKPMTERKNENHAEVLKLFPVSSTESRRFQQFNDLSASGDKWTCDHSDDTADADKHVQNMTLLPLDELFKARLPHGFATSCLNAIDDFVVRKEQVTTSRLYVTVTTITFNRIPIMPN